MKDLLVFNNDMAEEELVNAAKAAPKIKKVLENKKIVKIIYITNKVLNFVIK